MRKTKFYVFVRAERINELLEDWIENGETDIVLRNDMKVPNYRTLMTESFSYASRLVERLHLEQDWAFVKTERN